jgi:hypothetical protein
LFLIFNFFRSWNRPQSRRPQNFGSFSINFPVTCLFIPQFPIFEINNFRQEYSRKWRNECQLKQTIIISFLSFDIAQSRLLNGANRGSRLSAERLPVLGKGAVDNFFKSEHAKDGIASPA